MEVQSLTRKSWIDELFGFSSKPHRNGDGGRHNTLYRKDKSGERLSWDTDKNGDHQRGTGHNSNKNKRNW